MCIFQAVRGKAFGDGREGFRPGFVLCGPGGATYFLEEE